jgi:excisionase family DNA binding protein
MTAYDRKAWREASCMLEVETMNKEEAAGKLGISVRSLQRTVKSGKLDVAYQRGESGKMEAVFNADEIARYAVQMREVVKPEREESSLELVVVSRDASRQEFVALVAASVHEAVKADKREVIPIADKLLFTLSEAQSMTGLSRETLRGAIDDKKLKAKIIGRGWRVKRADLEAYVKRL